MKRILTFVAILPFFYACSNIITVKTEQRSSDPAIAHESVRDFTLAVNRLLKNNYPSRIKKITTTLSVKNIPIHGNGENIYSVEWYAEIEPTDDPSKADYYFNGTGGLFAGKTADEAEQGVELENRLSMKTQLIMDEYDEKYKNHRMPITTTTTDSLIYPDGKKEWWCSKHSFCTANKN